MKSLTRLLPRVAASEQSADKGLTSAISKNRALNTHLLPPGQPGLSSHCQTPCQCAVWGPKTSAESLTPTSLPHRAFYDLCSYASQKHSLASIQGSDCTLPWRR